MEKLVLINAVKYAALDSYGMGVEMEGGKPGCKMEGIWSCLGSRWRGVYSPRVAADCVAVNERQNANHINCCLRNCQRTQTACHPERP